MKRTFHPCATSPAAALLAAGTIVLLSWSCTRTIEDEESRELVEHRIEPCRQWCTAQLDPECGVIPEDRVLWRTAEECAEDCAAVEAVYSWDWLRRADRADVCAEEWIAASDCVVALTCEERLRYFREFTPDPHDDYPCKEEFDDQLVCLDAEPDRGDD